MPTTDTPPRLHASDLALLKKQVRMELETEFEAELIADLTKHVAEVRADLEAFIVQFRADLDRMETRAAETRPTA